jgi:hypothetical protein
LTQRSVIRRSGCFRPHLRRALPVRRSLARSPTSARRSSCLTSGSALRTITPIPPPTKRSCLSASCRARPERLSTRSSTALARGTPTVTATRTPSIRARSMPIPSGTRATARRPSKGTAINLSGLTHLMGSPTAVTRVRTSLRSRRVASRRTMTETDLRTVATAAQLWQTPINIRTPTVTVSATPATRTRQRRTALKSCAPGSSRSPSAGRRTRR